MTTGRRRRSGRRTRSPPAVEVAEAVAKARGGARVSVPYYDLTVSAAKSVSVLHASLKIAAQEAFTRGDLVAAGKLHAEADGIQADLEAAARFAVERAEAEACYTRTGHHSAATGEWRDGAGLIAPTFTHHISRDGDPQLHVHIAIANLVQRADGGDEKFRQLDTRALHNQRLSIAAQVDREMEARMIARGYTMVPREDGNGCEVGGVSQQVMDLFSSRKATLSTEVAKLAEAYRRKYGHEPSKRTLWLMGQQAAAMTRRPKSAARRVHGTSGGDADEAERLAAWEAQTAEREMTALSRVHKDVAAFVPLWRGRPIDDDIKAMAARAAVAEVQRHHAVWSLSELRFEVGRALPPGASAELVRQVAGLAVTPGSGTGVLLVTAPEVTDVIGAGDQAGRDEHLPAAERGPVHHRRTRRPRGADSPAGQAAGARQGQRGHGPAGPGRVGPDPGAGERGGPAADQHHRDLHPDRTGGRGQDAHDRRLRGRLDDADRAPGHRDHHRAERGPADGGRGPGRGLQQRGVPGEDARFGPAALPGEDRRGGRAGAG